MTHSCISGPGHGPRWESKVGSDLRIQHGLGELVGASYGRVQAFYRKRSLLAAEEAEGVLRYATSLTAPTKMKLNNAQSDALNAEIAGVSQNLRTEFEPRFDAWRATWSAPHTAHLSDPSFVRYNKEFADLIALGEDTIPLIVERLLDPENYLALQLYDALQPDAASVVPIDSEDEALLTEGEQGRASRTVERWLANL